MKKIDVSKNTAVKSTPETFELIKALFRANGANGELPYFPNKFAGTDQEGSLYFGKAADDTEITLQELAFESLAAPDWATMIILGDDGEYKWIDHNVPTKRVRVKFVDSDDDAEGCTPRINTIYTQKVVLQKQPTTTENPQSTHYRKISGAEPWEIIKRWQESDDLYVEHTICGFAKIRHIQQLAQMIHQDRVYEQCSEFEVFADKFKDATGCQGMDTIRAAFEAGLRFKDQP